MAHEQSYLGQPEDDIVAHFNIWRDTRLGAEELPERWNARLFLANHEQSDFLRTADAPIVGVGKLVELMSVVSLLRSADSMRSQNIYHLWDGASYHQSA
jgi:hypothetical protein